MRKVTARPRLAPVRYDKPPSSPLLRLTVSWCEHEEAWQEYSRRGGSKDCEAVATGCGFSLSELRELLGREPATLREHRIRTEPAHCTRDARGRFAKRKPFSPGPIPRIPCHIELECTEDLRCIVRELSRIRVGHRKFCATHRQPESAQCRAWTASRIDVIEAELIRRREWRQTA